VLDAVAISSRQADGEGQLNEHVWYDAVAVESVSKEITAALSTIDPANAATYQQHASAFGTSLTQLTAREQQIADGHAGTAVAVTEPVPLFLLAACRLVDATPPAFSEAIEEGSDVPPTVLNDVLALFTERGVSALVYNEQTTGPQTEAVLNAAEDNGIPVVGVTETLPAGEDYLSWMNGTLDALSKALG
jgi:zinc/manganese transport system substrate-binding protein